MQNEIITCQDLRFELKRLIDNGNLSKSQSRLYANFFSDDGKNKIMPMTDVLFRGNTLTMKTSLHGKGMLLYKFANEVMDLSYKHRLHFDQMLVKVDDSAIKSVEGNSITKNCVLVV